MAHRNSKLLIFVAILLAAVSARFVDRYRRELSDVLAPDEEEVGQFGHEQTVITAEEQDSTTAKATSSVHNVNYADSHAADHVDNHANVEQNWSESDIKVAEALTASNAVTINSSGEVVTGEDGE